MEQEELSKVLETLLFITDQPLSLNRICRVIELRDEKIVRDAVALLQKEYLESSSAVQILEIGGGYQMSTKPEYGRWVRKLFHEKMTVRLSNAALENLAIIAYRQPITRAEIELIRGVEVIASLETLIERGLVKIVGRKDTVGRPLLYGTTDGFLRLFGLNSINDLPKVETFEIKRTDEKDIIQPELFHQKDNDNVSAGSNVETADTEGSVGNADTENNLSETESHNDTAAEEA